MANDSRTIADPSGDLSEVARRGINLLGRTCAARMKNQICRTRWMRLVPTVLALTISVCATPSAYAEDVTIDRIFTSSFGIANAANDPRGRVLGLWFVNFQTHPFTIDTRHVIAKLTCMHFCQPHTTRTLAAADNGDIRTVGAYDRSTAAVAVPIPDDLPWGIYSLTVLDDGRVARSLDGGFEALPKINAVISIPTFNPKSDLDEHLRAIRAEYVGRTVQGFGPLSIDCDDPDAEAKEQARDAVIKEIQSKKLYNPMVPPIPQGPITQAYLGNEPSLVVSAIDRPVGPTRGWKIGGPVASRINYDYNFVAVAPLEIKFTSESFHAPCVNPHLWLADFWEVHRVLWIHAPTHELESTAIVKGMPRLTVAHILGFPSLFGTVEEMNQLDFWPYLPVLPPFSSSVRFRHGLVSEYQPPGTPP